MLRCLSFIFQSARKSHAIEKIRSTPCLLYSYYLKWKQWCARIKLLSAALTPQLLHYKNDNVPPPPHGNVVTARKRTEKSAHLHFHEKRFTYAHIILNNDFHDDPRGELLIPCKQPTFIQFVWSCDKMFRSALAAIVKFKKVLYGELLMVAADAFI